MTYCVVLALVWVGCAGVEYSNQDAPAVSTVNRIALGVCGDGICDEGQGESCGTCPEDCGSCPSGPYCGDGVCNNGETCGSCPGDCGACPPPAPYCGDRACNNGETCITCPGDCGGCPTPQPFCGDGICNLLETCATCSGDCGVCPGTPRNVTVLVNGSFDDSPPWMDVGSPESVAIATTLGVEPLRFRWTDNSAVFAPFYSGIFNGGVALANFINGLQLAAQDNLDVIAHSHGGNVVKVASQFIGHPIRHLINLGTPINYDLPLMTDNVALHYCQVSSHSDDIQFLGSSPWQVGFYVYSIAEAALWMNQAELDLLDGNWDAFFYDSALIALYEELAESWWLSTKVALDGADNFMFFDGQSHADLHEPPVWNAIKASCALN